MTSKRLLLLFLPFLLLAGETSYLWEMKKERYRLVLFLDKKVCDNLQKGDLFLFITDKGKVYRKTVGRKFYNCKLYKVFKEKPNRIRVLYVDRESLKVNDLGIVEE